jgi:hypothetical protein
VFVLAAIAGTTAVDVDPPAALVEYATTLAREGDDLPPAAVALAETTTEEIAALVNPGDGDADRVPSSATDP